VHNTAHTLVIMRHAKAEPYAATDEERELTAQGESDAVAAGEWLAEQGIDVDRALVSGAARARGTWAGVAEGADLGIEATFDRSLYAAEPETALDLIRLTQESVRCLLVIGHNPTMAHLAQMLDDGDGDSEAIDGMATGFPAASLAVFEVDGAWSELEISAARLTAFHVNRG
jgi:phosphohistidine phosphatase